MGWRSSPPCVEWYATGIFTISFSVSLSVYAVDTNELSVFAQLTSPGTIPLVFGTTAVAMQSTEVLTRGI
jgi:hypothetical protein